VERGADVCPIRPDRKEREDMDPTRCSSAKNRLTGPDREMGEVLLGGRYRVGALIRSGGAGAVYRGEHLLTGRHVALKLLHVQWWIVDEVLRRFEREARIASNLQSKHIVQVLDAGRDPGLGLFMAMELLDGEDLEQRLARSGALPIRTACELAFQVACGLEKAHAAEIAHRDLKPGNIFLAASDEEAFVAKLLDFGVAKRLSDPSPANAKLTRPGAALGTPQYMSPEQGRGQIDVDARTDIYSLGAVLYEMIVGRPLVPDHPSDNPVALHFTRTPAPRVSASLPAVDPRLDKLVADMLAPDRQERVRTMRMARERLAEILEDAPPLGPGEEGLDSSGFVVTRRTAPAPAEASSRTRIFAASRTAVTRADGPPSDGRQASGHESVPPVSGVAHRLAARFSTRAETKIEVWRLSARAGATEVIGFDADRNVRARFEITRELRDGVETVLVVFHSPEEGALRMDLDGMPIGEISGVVDRALCRGIVRDLV
jgi:hypothetical protein